MHSQQVIDANGVVESPRALFTNDTAPEDTVEWSQRDAVIVETKKDGTTKPIFDQKGVEFPTRFSQLAVNVVASKYFYGPNRPGLSPGNGGREHSFKQLVRRVTNQLALWSEDDGVTCALAYTDNNTGLMTTRELCEKLAWLIYHQKMAFNSPVWFNVGVHTYGASGDTDGYYWDHTNQEPRRVPRGQAYKYPQGSACFLLSVKDNMESISQRAAQEMMIFKYGSGCGTDNSTLRSRREVLSGGGRPSGPVSFMEIYDAVAATTKSGGGNRRAAKMEILRCDHPDILEFIAAKSTEEKKAHALINAGYPCDFNPGSAYASVKFQNSNMSTRATDKFMEAATATTKEGQAWQTLAVKTGTPKNAVGDDMPCYNASEMLDQIAEGTWLCGDPGMQFDDTIQGWHTSPNSGRITTSNPCAEFLFLDDTACNLASLNLASFVDEDEQFDVEEFCVAVHHTIIAQDAIVSHASYPTAKITENSHRFRPLGLGYSNLGALLRSWGLAYDSDESRALAACITALMHGKAYLTSSELADAVGPFDGYADNREPMLRVIDKHANEADTAVARLLTMRSPQLARLRPTIAAVTNAVTRTWNAVRDRGPITGFRNSQVTLLAPAGTISFLMDCDTTGVEPALALVAYKKLAGGGNLKIVDQTVPAALRALGLVETDVVFITDYVDKHDTLEGCVPPTHGEFSEDELAVFDCAFPTRPGGRAIHWRGHLKMMAAVQPFLSGSISKTVNTPADITPAEIREAYIEAWRLGLKCVAIYRDGSKMVQPLSTTAHADSENPQQATIDTVLELAQQMSWIKPGDSIDDLVALLRKRGVPDEAPAAKPATRQAATGSPPTPVRQKLPKTRQSLTHHFRIGTHEGYLTVGLYPNGSPGELFITMAKEGSTISGLMDTIGALTSIGLQYGVPLDVLAAKLAHCRFEPSGMTDDHDVPIAKSVTDYVFRWLGCQFVAGFKAAHSPYTPPEEPIDQGPVVTVEDAPAGLPGALALGLAPTLNGAAYPAYQNGHAKVPFGGLQVDAPACPDCGSIMVRAGACYRCLNCGSQGGCG